MKISRRLSLLLAALAVTLTLVIAASAQMVGGYKPLARNDADALAAAQFAVAAQAEKESLVIELMSVRQAEGQLVQGMNYRLCLKVKVSADEDADYDIMTVRAVVYRDLRKNYKLTRWTPEECRGR